MPRTFGAGHPLAGHLRLTVRDPHENDRLIAAAQALADGGSPHDHAARRPRRSGRARAGASRVARSTRETVDHDHARPRRRRASTSVDTGIGFYDHLLGSIAHHGLFDLAISADGDLQVDEHHTVEDVALVLGAAFAEALGDRAGIARFGQSSVPMDESIATAVVDVGGRPYAVIDLPFRGERVGGLPLQLVEHALEAFARTAGVDAPPVRHGPQRPPPRRGRVQGARSRAAGRLRARSAADGRGLDEGRRSDEPRDRGIAVVDYGAGNLVSIDQALTTVGADVRIARDAAALAGADALVVPGVGAAAPAMARLDRRGLTGPIRGLAGRPAARSSASASGLQLLFEGSDEDGATTLGVAAGPDASASRTPRRCRTSAGTRSSGRARTRCSTASPTAPTSTSSTRTPARAGARPATTSCSPGPTHGRPFVSADRARTAARRPVPPRAKRHRTACGCSRNFVDLVRAA